MKLEIMAFARGVYNGEDIEEHILSMPARCRVRIVKANNTAIKKDNSKKNKEQKEAD